MSADTCIVFYGLRFEISESEINRLEERTDARQVVATREKLDFYWGNFASPADRYLGFIGTLLACMGPENDAEVALSGQALQSVMEITRTKLLSAGMAGEPSLYVQWQPDC